MDTQLLALLILIFSIVFLVLKELYLPLFNLFNRCINTDRKIALFISSFYGFLALYFVRFNLVLAIGFGVYFFVFYWKMLNSSTQIFKHVMPIKLITQADLSSFELSFKPIQQKFEENLKTLRGALQSKANEEDLQFISEEVQKLNKIKLIHNPDLDDQLHNLDHMETLKELHKELIDRGKTDISFEDFKSVAIREIIAERFVWNGDQIEIVKLFFVLFPNMREWKTGGIREFIYSYFNVKTSSKASFANSINKVKSDFSSKHSYLLDYVRW